MAKRYFGIPRMAVTAIVLIAAALVLLRPVCESWHAGARGHASPFAGMSMLVGMPADHAGGQPDIACCASAGEIGVVPAVQAVGFGGDSPALASPFVPAAFIVLVLVVHAASWRRPIARTPQSYYLRSARILR